MYKVRDLPQINIYSVRIGVADVVENMSSEIKLIQPTDVETLCYYTTYITDVFITQNVKQVPAIH